MGPAIMVAPILRPYQDSDVGNIRAAYAGGARRVLYQAPTGSGKTVLFAFVLAAAVGRGNRVVVLGHRQEIVDQISGALTVLGVEHVLVTAGYSGPAAPVMVCSVAALVRRLHLLAGIDFIVIDEAHHAVAGMWMTILATAAEARLLGVTATPERLDGKGLRDIFDVLIIGPTVAELIEAGWLAPFAAYAPGRRPDLSGVRTRMGDYATGELSAVMSRGIVIGAAVDEYVRLCAGAPAIAFCVDIDHSELVAARFRERGWRAAHVDGETERDERRRLIAALATGEIQVLANCGLISEGLDVPAVVAALLLRPTKSLALYLQQVGRALRPAEGKARALVLDHAANIYKHGLPDAGHNWTLDGRESAANDDDAHGAAASLKRCEACGAINSSTAGVCSECGTPFPVPKIIRPEISAPLIKVDQLSVMNYYAALRWAWGDEDRLRLMATAKGYKPGFAWHKMRAAEEYENFDEWRAAERLMRIG
jgi:superfamily II DNA or RNA helicase